MIYLCAAYLAIWVLIFAYLFFLRSKQKDLQEQLKRIADVQHSR